VRAVEERCAAAHLDVDGRGGRFYGDPGPGFESHVTVPYAAHAKVAAGARDSGYQRGGRELWVTIGAAYVATPGGDAERWPAPSDQLSCG
jgi:hypothetical protein